MNALSWILYFANVVDNFKAVTIITFVISIIWFGIIAISNTENDKDEKNPFYFNRIATFLVIMIVISVFIPGSRTLYLIAGSELTEAAVTSEEGQQLIDEIREAIRVKLNPTEE